MDDPPADERPRVERAVGEATRLLAAALRDLAWAAVVALSAAALVHAAGVRSWPFELVHHFVPAYVLSATILLLYALSVRDLRLTAASTGLFAFFIWVVATTVPPVPHGPSVVLEASNQSPSAAVSLPPVAATGPLQAGPRATAPSMPGPPPISIITNNVFCGNWDKHGLGLWLRTRPADVVVLQEVPRFVDKELADLGGAYPYTARIRALDSSEHRVMRLCQGIVVLSVFPITSSTVFQPIEGAWPALIAGIDVDPGRHVSLAVIHASDPIRAEGLVWRDEFFRRLAAQLNTMHDPLIVLGDFNASPYTPAFRSFLAEARLTPSPWTPATYPYHLGTLGISIDHVLVRGAELLRLEPLVAVGSDHRPLRASIALPQASTGVPPSVADSAVDPVEPPIVPGRG